MGCHLDPDPRKDIQLIQCSKHLEEMAGNTLNNVSNRAGGARVLVLLYGSKSNKTSGITWFCGTWNRGHDRTNPNNGNLMTTVQTPGDGRSRAQTDAIFLIYIHLWWNALLSLDFVHPQKARFDKFSTASKWHPKRPAWTFSCSPICDVLRTFVWFILQDGLRAANIRLGQAYHASSGPFLILWIQWCHLCSLKLLLRIALSLHSSAELQPKGEIPNVGIPVPHFMVSSIV